MYVIPADETSWIEVPPGHHFPIQNLPLGLALIEDAEAVVSRVGDTVVNVSALMESGWVPKLEPVLAGELEITSKEATELRKALARVLGVENRGKATPLRRFLQPLEETELLVPMPIGAFVDFYSGINHASNVGRMFRPDQPPLLPNYRHLPVAYNGRASSVVVSGTAIPRPRGIFKVGDELVYEPTRELDFELETGFFLAAAEDEEAPIDTPEAADARILGFVLVNDWSARDVQRFEYQPLGPFLAKSFATSVSPWIVLKDALEPCRAVGPVQDPTPLPHLTAPGPRHYDLNLEVWLQTEAAEKPERISATNFAELYWSPVQQLLHQASNGTLVEAGDLYASGTISGAEPGSYGSLLELTWRGQNPLTLAGGESRTFLQDGDTVTLIGWAEKGGVRVGLGEVEAQVIPSAY
jgi:fumarylacetoacetase